jgi:hypothetical protein
MKPEKYVGYMLNDSDGMIIYRVSPPEFICCLDEDTGILVLKELNNA